MVAFKRDPEFIHSNLVEGDDSSVSTKVACRILVPERYTTRHLASIGTEVYILGFFAILMGERYGVSRTLSMMRIKPSSTEKVEMGGMTFLDFHFFPGDTVFANTNLVMNDTLSYYAYDELVAKGNVPWYYNYIDIAKFFDTDQEFAGINLGNRAVIQLVLSTIARDPSDLTRLYRHILMDLAVVENNPPVITPFKSVIWNTSDTTSKLIGAYFSDSITSALVNPSEKVERIEELLRT